jgi:hypothetical protein
LANTFAEIFTKLEALDVEAANRELARETVEKIQEQAEQGDDADEGSLKNRFRTLALMGPEILDVVTATLLGGPVGGIAAVVLNVAQKARDDAGL